MAEEESRADGLNVTRERLLPASRCQRGRLSFFNLSEGGWRAHLMAATRSLLIDGSFRARSEFNGLQ
jgi:hypothetical protein